MPSSWQSGNVRGKHIPNLSERDACNVRMALLGKPLKTQKFRNLEESMRNVKKILWIVLLMVALPPGAGPACAEPQAPVQAQAVQTQKDKDDKDDALADVVDVPSE